MKKLIALGLASTALLAGPVLAQTSAAPATTTAATTAAGHFVSEQTANEWRASKLIGVNVYGADNARIGDINEILVDRNGNAKAVVIGVGGFLGIGEKNVAVAYSALEWANAPMRTSTNPAPTNTASTTTNVVNSASNAAGAARDQGAAADAPRTAGAPATATTASGATRTTSADGAPRSSSAEAANNGYPDHAVLRMTKADLDNAPTFRYFGDRTDAARAPANTTTTTTSAPAR